MERLQRHWQARFRQGGNKHRALLIDPEHIFLKRSEILSASLRELALKRSDRTMEMNRRAAKHVDHRKPARGQRLPDMI